MHPVFTMKLPDIYLAAKPHDVVTGKMPTEIVPLVSEYRHWLLTLTRDCLRATSIITDGRNEAYIRVKK